MEVADIFGYVKPVISELLVKDYEFYKATYCGICRSMKRHTGSLSNVTLSYDSVLLSLVRMLFLPDGDIGAKKRRCIAHPIKSRPMLNENSATEYTARVFAILTYYKMRDDIGDEGFSKKLLLAPARPILRHGKNKAKIPDIADVIKSRLEAISELESNEERSVDRGASLFGELLGEIFAYGLSGSDKIVTYSFGYHLGRFILSADAAEDYEDDRLNGKYNPYVLMYDGKPLTEENKATIKCALILECKEIERAMDLMPFGSRLTIENIIKNIVYRGLIKRIDFLDTKPEEIKTKNAKGRK